MTAPVTRRVRRRAGDDIVADRLRTELTAFFAVQDAEVTVSGEQQRALVVHTICAGNVCRSPLAEGLLRSELERVGIAAAVTSSGLTALVGAAADEPVRRIAAEHGVDLAAHRARMFEPAFAVEADLVLTATSAQRDAVLALAPAATRRTFPLLTFAEVASGRMPVAGHAVPARAPLEPRMLIDEASVAVQLRGFSEQHDIPDPYRRDERAHREVFSRISAATRGIAEALQTPGRGL